MIFDSLFRGRRRRKLLAEQIRDEWRGYLRQNLGVYELLPEELRWRMHDSIRIIVPERRWIGCNGLVVTHEMKVTIAGQASLLLLGDQNYFYERVTSILVYPTPMREKIRTELDVGADENVFSGKAYQQGEIVLSWPDVLAGGRDPRDGENVVLHEFAHHLDSLDGEMGGSPPSSPSQQLVWKEVIDYDLERLRNDLATDRPTLLNPVAAESPVEFFAYGAECFFEQGPEMRRRHPELYQCYRDFFRLDPASWLAPPSVDAGALLPHDPKELADELERRPNDPDWPADLPALRTSDQYFTRGSEYFHIGRFDLAEADFNQTIRLSPDDQEALVYRAVSRFYLERVEAALSDAERAVRLNSDDLEAMRIRGICRVAMGNIAEGLADLNDSIECDKNDTLAWFYRGIAHAALEQWTDALRDFSAVLLIDRHDAQAYYRRAQCHVRMGNQQAAKHDFAKARELGLDFVEP